MEFRGDDVMLSKNLYLLEAFVWKCLY